MKGREVRLPYDDDISVQQLGVSKRTKEKKICFQIASVLQTKHELSITHGSECESAAGGVEFDCFVAYVAGFTWKFRGDFFRYGGHRVFGHCDQDQP